MLCAQYGNTLSSYGNIQLGFYNPPVYTWGAWELPYPQHYQPPLTEKESRIIEEHRGNAPKPASLEAPAVDHTETIRRLNAEVTHRANETILEAQNKAIVEKLRRPVRKPKYNDDEDAFFMMM